MKLPKILFLSAFAFLCFSLSAQEIIYSTTKPIVLRRIPNKINFHEPINTDSLIVFSNFKYDVTCFNNGQLYFIPYMKNTSTLYIAKELNGDTIILDSLNFNVVNLNSQELIFRTKKNRWHSGFTIASDTNSITYKPIFFYKLFEIEKYLKISEISLKLVAQENGLEKIDTILKFDSSSFYIWPLIKDIPANYDVFLELMFVDFSYQNLPCECPFGGFRLYLDRSKTFPIGPY